MKRKFVLLTILMCILGGFNLSNLNAQTTTVTIGYDSDPDGGLEWCQVDYILYNYSISQMIYTKDELEAVGITSGSEITSIGFMPSYIGSEESDAINRDVEVYVMNTSLTSLTPSTIAVSNPNFVGTVNWGKDQWSNITFTTPFEYNGENILVCVNDITGKWKPAHKYYAYNVSECRGIYTYNDNNAYTATSENAFTDGTDGYTMTSTSDRSEYYNPCISITFESNSGPKPLSATASAEKESIYSDETVQLTATANGGSGNYTYSWSPAAGLDNATIATPTFTPTAAGTYTFTCTVSAGTETVITNGVTVIVEDAPLRCNVIFTLTDSYGDGWNENKLQVTYGSTTEELTLSTGKNGTFTLQIPQGTIVTVTYTPDGMYTSENSYAITYEGGENITSGTGSNNTFSETFTVDCSPKAPEAPEVFAKATSETSVLLAWSNVEGATSYNIYNGNNIVKEGVENTTYTINDLTTGQEYCYTVTAENEVGESDESNEACVTPKAIPTIDLAKYYRINVYGSLNYLYFSDPYYYYYTSGTTQATVAATLESSRQIFQIEDAGNGNYYVKTLDGYYIKCADQPNADGNNWWSVFAYSNENSNEIKTPLHFDYVDDESFYIRDFDKVLGNGSDANKLPNSNYFKVDNGVYCDASIDNQKVVTWVLEEVPTLEGVKPTGLVAELNGRSAILTWDVVEGATSYNVYLDGNKISTDMITTQPYTVDGLSAETEYCFTVTANNLISESSHSEEACVTTGAKELPEVPNLLSISVNTTTITLTWEASAGATSYNVYRDGVQIQTGITELTYSDSGLTEEMRYCYSVTAVNSDGESELSDELCAKTTKAGSGGDEEIEEIAGIGSNYNNNLPIYSGVTGKYSMSQQYYTNDEINNTGGNITSISYYVYANASLTHNLEIYLNNVDEFGFEIDNMFKSPCRQVSTNDLVFEGDVTFPNGEGWFEINFNLGKHFLYTGNHILVTVVDNTPSTTGKAFYTRLTGKENCTGYYNSDNSIDPTINSYQMSVITRRNDIRFTFAAPASTIEFINDGNWNDDSNWNTGVVPSAEDDVIIKANATINGDVAVKHLSVEGGSLTIESGSLTVTDIMVNNYAEDLIIKDGAQLLQGYDKVKGTFQMNITPPDEWSEWNKTGWQFIASPFTNAAVSQFTDADTYDLYKFDGSHENITEEWRNHKDDDANFETEFVSGRGYMASYESNTTATLSGTFYAGSSITYPVTYQDIQEGETHWPNFHLLGNPFTFNMDLSKLNMTNMAEGVAVVNDKGGYDYMETGTINVGDGFFVKSAAASPSVSYGTRGSNNNNVSENISVRVSNSTSRDNVVLNFAGADKVGFPKLNARNEDIAYLYVVDNEERYGIFNYDKDVKEVPLSFETQKMGRYTISVDAEGEYETIVLVDRQTGIETNMLLEDYNFTATTSKKENTDRFIVRFTFKSDEVTETERFAYQSGDELIIEAEGTVQLFDVMGRMLYINDIENHGDRINVGHLNNAAYILRLVNGDGVKVQKVIIY